MQKKSTMSQISLYSLLIYAFKKSTINTIIICLCLFLGASYTVVFSEVILWIARSIENNSPNLYLFLFIFPILDQCYNIIWRTYDYCYAKVSSTIKARIIQSLFENMLFQDITFFKKTPAGKKVNQIMDIARSIEELFDLITRNFLFKIVSIVLATIKIYSYSTRLAYIISAWILVFFISMYAFSSTIVFYTNKYGEARSNVGGSILDTILNIHTIKNFFTQKYEKRHLKSANKTMVGTEQKMLNIQNKLKSIIWVSYSIMIYFVISEILFLSSNNLIEIITIPIILNIINAIGSDFAEILQDGSDILNEYGILKQSKRLIQTPDIQDEDKAESIIVTQGEIKFHNVSFQYQGEKKPTFENLNITIPAKQRIALVGYSGSGKTTFINLINRTFEINSGIITIDQKNISKITQKSLNREICFVHQDTILFNRTILENITYGSKEYDMNDVIKAAKKAHIHHVIINMPDEYGTLCGERGNKLSGGQKQRILIARAILLDKPILIMDEATSALDQITEKHIQESINYLMQNKTSIIIAHKLSTIQTLDRILVFDQGKIIEDGSHKELLEKKGKYYKMYHGILEI